MDGYVFLEYMSFKMTCLMRAYVLRVVMLCRRKCREKSCIGGVHVFRMAYLTIGCVLLENIFFSG